jgi:hypothetical protein
MVKLHVFGNKSKTVNNIRNLTVVKMISTARSNYPEILKIIKIAGHVDLDKLNMFSVYTQHLSLIVFEIKDEKY